MLHGARGSGKTTLIYNAMAQLKDEYICLLMDFQGINLTNFWETFGNTLRKLNTGIDLPNFQTSDDFFNLFISEGPETPFKNKKVVLFIDEFDKLLRAASEEQGRLLELLRLIKHRDVKSLHSVVAVGPFSILSLGAKMGSPFNVSEKISVRFWSKDEIKALLHQFSTDILDDVVTDIHERTNGHPGLVCMCCKAIAENIMLGENYDKWVRYATTSLTGSMMGWATIQRISMQLSLTEADLQLGATQNDIDIAKKAREYLRGVMPKGLQPFKERAANRASIAEYLASEGALLAQSNDTFRIPSPLIYALLSPALAVDGRKVRRLWPDFSDPNSVQQLIKDVVNLFDPLALERAVAFSFKKCRIPGISRDVAAPEEAAYASEFFAILQAALQSNVYYVLPEVNVPGGKSANSRCDVLIGSSSPFAVIEFCANVPDEVVKDHIRKTDAYAKHLGASQAWVVHFTITPADTVFTTALDECPNVNVVHVHHNKIPYQLLAMKFPGSVKWISEPSGSNSEL